MKRLLQLLTMITLLPFMIIGAAFEISHFGFYCGREAANNLLNHAFKKGPAQ